MEEKVAFDSAPPVMAWLTVLSERGWQVTYHDNEEMRGRREVGASEFPVRLSTRWFVRVSENGAEGVDVTINVPAFAETMYAKRRLRSRIEEWAEAVEGHCKTDQEFSVDVLGALREGRE